MVPIPPRPQLDGLATTVIRINPVICHCCHRDLGAIAFNRHSSICQGCASMARTCTECHQPLADLDRQPTYNRHRQCHLNLIWFRKQAKLERRIRALAKRRGLAA